ncbi:MAG: hypothetical protein RLZ72_208 [Actinomycetota bacterium]
MMGSQLFWILVLPAMVIAAAVSTIKWIRVAQREHYIPAWTNRIARQWLRNTRWGKVSLFVPAIVATMGYPIAAAGIGTDSAPDIAIAVFFVIALGLGTLWPWGLGFRGTSSKLAWTARAKRLAPVFFVLELAWDFLLIVVSVFGMLGAYFLQTQFTELPSAGYIQSGGTIIVIVLVGWVHARTLPIVMDLALAIMAPIEKAMSTKWLVAAQKKLRQVNPTVVAVTGSYGKTSTKGYIAHLVGAKYSVVPSPASFNNLLGLARAVNDKLTPGTEVFVAEMGVYKEGDIRELSKSYPPDIAAITTIGEAHLERMKNRETILRAKSEITEQAKTVVLPIDDPDLAALADRNESEGKRVVRVSASGIPADVTIDPVASTATIEGETVPVEIPGVGHAVNLAVAMGIAHALDVPLSAMAPRLSSLPNAAHRAEPQQAPTGAIIIDDSYNANPSGAARAVEGGAAMAAERGGPFIVITPGMIELGPVQVERNRTLAEQVAAVGAELFIVGYTNRPALLAGFPGAKLFAKRADAMKEALQRAGATGVILVENDLPDHFA